MIKKEKLGEIKINYVYEDDTSSLLPKRVVLWLYQSLIYLISEVSLIVDRWCQSSRCGSASHCETLSIAVASLSHQITLSQPPIAFTCSISLFAVFPLRTSPFW